MFIFYSDQGDTLPVGSTSDLFSVTNLSQGDILSYDGSHFTNTNILSGSNIDLINIDPSNLTGTIPYARLPNLAEITLSGNAVPPYIASITPITPTGTQNIEIIGEYFSPITQLNIPGVTVNSLEVRSPTKIVASISKTGLSGNKTITLSNGLNSNQVWSEGIKSVNILADPFWSSVSLFIKGDGSNNSTNITDSSSVPKTLIKIGDTKISTAQSKYGGSSIYFVGSGDLLQIASDPAFNFGTNNFTIEFWIYPLNSNYFLGKGDAATASGSMLSFSPYYGCSTYFNGGSSVSPAISFTLNVWQHIAIVRNGAAYTVFKNGVIHSSAILPSGAILNTVSNPLQFGGYAGQFINAYFDSIRITNMARYTASFNPETDTYLNI